MMKKNTDTCPCKCCTEREIGCHAICDKYKKWRDEVQEFNDKVAAKKGLTHDATDFINRKFRGVNKA